MSEKRIPHKKMGEGIYYEDERLSSILPNLRYRVIMKGMQQPNLGNDLIGKEYLDKIKNLPDKGYILVQLYQGYPGKGVTGYARILKSDSKAKIEDAHVASWVDGGKDSLVSEIAKKLFLEDLRPEGMFKDEVIQKLKKLAKTKRIIEKTLKEENKGFITYELAIETFKRIKGVDLGKDDEIGKIALMFPIEITEQYGIKNYILEKYKDPRYLDTMDEFKKWYLNQFTPALWKLIKENKVAQRILRKPNKNLGESPNQRIVAHITAKEKVKERYNKLLDKQGEVEGKLQDALTYVMERLKSEAPIDRSKMRFAGSSTRRAVRTPLSDIDLWVRAPYSNYWSTLSWDVFRKFGVRLNIVSKQELPDVLDELKRMKKRREKIKMKRERWRNRAKK